MSKPLDAGPFHELIAHWAKTSDQIKAKIPKYPTTSITAKTLREKASMFDICSEELLQLLSDQEGLC